MENKERLIAVDYRSPNFPGIDPIRNFPTDDAFRAKWAGRTHRAIRRTIIAHVLSNSDDTTGIKDEARRKEESACPDRIVTSLKENEFNVHPGIDAVMRELSDRIPERSGVSALVAFGSGVHGGMLIRDATGVCEDTDLDLGFIYNPRGIVRIPPKAIAWNLANFVTLELPHIADRHGMNGLHLCEKGHPACYHSPDLGSQKDALKQIMEVRKGNRFSVDQLLLYFEPSYPAEVNIHNRKNILQALAQLREDDTDDWREIVFTIMDFWRSVHKIKSKHFGIDKNSDRRTRALGNIAARDSGLVMCTHLMNLLRGEFE